jgi:hypothetical protein
LNGINFGNPDNLLPEHPPVPFALLIKPQEDVLFNGQTFSSRTGKTSGLPKLN